MTAAPTPALAALAELAEGEAKLLRAQRDPVPGPAGGQNSRRLRLSFELAVVDLEVREGKLCAAAPDPASPAPSVDGAEEDPWWALLGHPITRVHPESDGAIVVQFRRDDASPKLLVIGPVAGAVAVRTLI